MFAPVGRNKSFDLLVSLITLWISCGFFLDALGAAVPASYSATYFILTAGVIGFGLTLLSQPRAHSA